MSDVCFTDPEIIQQLILEDEELRYLELQEQKVPNWEMCGKTFLNPLYASGKRYKFRLKCGNTRKCGTGVYGHFVGQGVEDRGQ